MSVTIQEPDARAKVGLSTYALFWEWSDRNPHPIDLFGMVERTSGLGCNVLQICDYQALEEFSDEGLVELSEHANLCGVELELGTRDVGVDHLNRYLDLCSALDAHLLRSMVVAHGDGWTLGDARQQLASVCARLDDQGVNLALETYEQLPTPDLVNLVSGLNSPRIGIALDPANTVANMECPNEVIDMCADHVLNLHVKDFAFTRQSGWVGFLYAGAPMGDGRLDYHHELRAVRPVERGISQIVEHWLTWQGDIATTLDMERRWTMQTIDYIKENQNV